MLSGAHVIIYSTDPDADRAFLRDVLNLPYVDEGHGWLIFAMPPSEVAVHPSQSNDVHELYFMCDDIDSFIELVDNNGGNCSPVDEQNWGRLTTVKLPGGGDLGVYQPLHKRPPRL